MDTESKILVCYYRDDVAKAMISSLSSRYFYVTYGIVNPSSDPRQLASKSIQDGFDLLFLPAEFGNCPSRMGIETLLEIRKHSNVPVALVTTDNTVSLADGVKAWSMGANGYLVLPMGIKNIAQFATAMIGKGHDKPVMSHSSLVH